MRTLKDFTDKNRIAVPTIKMSLQAIYLQMALEQEFGEGSFKKFDSMMVQLGHPQATLALLDPRNPVDSHFSGPPFMQTALKNPAIPSRYCTSVDLVGPSTSLLAYTTAKFYDANPEDDRHFRGGAERREPADPDRAQEGGRSSISMRPGRSIRSTRSSPWSASRGRCSRPVPKGTMKFAEFMHKVGTLDRKPASWKDYFFPSIHGANGD